MKVLREGTAELKNGVWWWSHWVIEIEENEGPYTVDEWGAKLLDYVRVKPQGLEFCGFYPVIQDKNKEESENHEATKNL